MDDRESKHHWRLVFSPPSHIDFVGFFFASLIRTIHLYGILNWSTRQSKSTIDTVYDQLWFICCVDYLMRVEICIMYTKVDVFKVVERQMKACTYYIGSVSLDSITRWRVYLDRQTLGFCLLKIVSNGVWITGSGRSASAFLEIIPDEIKNICFLKIASTSLLLQIEPIPNRPEDCLYNFHVRTVFYEYLWISLEFMDTMNQYS